MGRSWARWSDKRESERRELQVMTDVQNRSSRLKSGAAYFIRGQERRYEKLALCWELSGFILQFVSLLM